jgi:hypothetical protein
VKYILFIILVYVLYQFIFNLVIPVYQATQKIKKGFGEMNARMNEQQQQQQQTSRPAGKTSGSRAKTGDYIEFEEVK